MGESARTELLVIFALTRTIAAAVSRAESAGRMRIGLRPCLPGFGLAWGMSEGLGSRPDLRIG